MAQPTVFQFKIILQDVIPSPWRRIQMAESCTFWDLHVAIQNVMGWWDQHLHEFSVIDPSSEQRCAIGYPDEDDERVVLPSWTTPVQDYLIHPVNEVLSYLYDFGDSWKHRVEFEGRQSQDAQLPCCLDGRWRCPPEDVGGVRGYHEFLRAIVDPEDPEHENYLQWVGGSFDPTAFTPAEVKFDDPRQRLRVALSEEDF